MTDMSHPVWCSPQHCDAVPVDPNLPMSGTAHRSAPVPIRADDVIAPRKTISASLSQPVCPWPTRVWLDLAVDGEPVGSWEARTVRDVLADLAALVDQAVNA
jgi:hypothetical protein